MRTLSLAIALFVAQGLLFAGDLPLWSEQSSTVVAPTFAVVDAPRSLDTGVLTPEPSCEGGLARSAVRPVAYVCAEGLSWPVLGSAYASPVLVWPLGVVPLLGGTILHVRMLGLLIGVLGLLVLYDLVRSMADERHAAVTVLFASLSSPYVLLHALAVYYEVVPTLLLLAGCAIWARSHALSGWRAWLVGLLFGLAILSNAKALVILVLILIGLRVTRADAWPREAVLRVALGAALPMACIVLLAASDPHAGVSSQIGVRLTTLLMHLSPSFIVLEAGNVALFAVDFGFYVAMAGGGEPVFLVPSIVLSALALMTSTAALVKALRGHAHKQVAAVGSLLLWGYVVFVALVYQQTPSANYGPLVHLFPVLFASAFCSLCEAVEARWPSVKASASQWQRGLLALACVGLALTLHWPHTAIRSLAPRVLSEMAQHIRDAAQPGDAATLTLAYNHAGIFDALASLPQPTLAAHPLFAGCAHGDEGPARAEEAAARAETCVDAPMRLVACGDAPRLVVLALEAARVDEPVVSRLPESLARAAEQCGATLHVEAVAPQEGALLQLIRIVPSH